MFECCENGFLRLFFSSLDFCASRTFLIAIINWNCKPKYKRISFFSNIIFNYKNVKVHVVIRRTEKKEKKTSKCWKEEYDIRREALYRDHFSSWYRLFTVPFWMKWQSLVYDVWMRSRRHLLFKQSNYKQKLRNQSFSNKRIFVSGISDIV